jgi:FkbM family methyltransferase
MLTAAVRDLHRAAPGRFQTDVRTSVPALWENNPFVTPLCEGEAGVESLDMHYPLIHQSNQRPYHFLHGYAQYLEERLGLHIPVTQFAGDIHLTREEREAPPLGVDRGVPEHFWIVVAGGKFDFTAKWWDPAAFQQVVDHFRRRIAFVQCGEQGHWHPRLNHVVDLVGRTSTREFIRLMYHADGVLCPVTFAMHLAAAVPTRPGRSAHRPAVVVAGGREPPSWEAYPHHQFLSTVGALPCCAEGGCWKSRCQLVGDGDDKDRHNVCEQPVQVTADLRIARCMMLITPADVIRRIELYYEGGALGLPGAAPPAPPPPAPEPPGPVLAPPTPAPAPVSTMKVLLRFRHGLGDAVQLTSVLAHLRHYHPDWEVDVAAPVGKHSAYHGQCWRVFALDREAIDTAGYQRVWDLDWHEPAGCYPNSPATKAERCIREVFGLEPVAELCRYTIRRSQRADELARRYLERICQCGPRRDGRFPAVLLHYQGNSSRSEKDLSAEQARALCDEILESAAVPVILDWDNRSQLPDGVRIFNPHVHEELWGGTGTGDAEALAALIERSSLLVGVDSGPLHVAAATTTPTLGVWTRHHPLHYFGLADNVLHLVPEGHESMIRGNREAGTSFFRSHYRHQPYHDLQQELRQAVRERLRVISDGLFLTRGFWIRGDNARQDLVVVGDVAERDCYRVADLPMPRPVVVDVGAHIGCFSKRVHDRNPLARLVAVECCPENIPALERNVGSFAAVVQAALTYEPEVALLNAVYADCLSTGGSTVVGRAELQRRLQGGEVAAQPGPGMPGEYWADLRPIRTFTLEQLIEEHALERIDVLKLDCEGSEFSILGGTTSLDRIGLIVGEYHGRDAFLELVRQRFAGWDFQVLRDGDPGTFWLVNPAAPRPPFFALQARDVNGVPAVHADIPNGEVPAAQPNEAAEHRRILAQLRATGYGEAYYRERRAAGVDYLAYGDWQEAYGRWLAGALGLAGRRVLDVGCACGAVTRALGRAGARAHGIDVSEHLIALGRSRWPEMAERLHVGDAVNLHFCADAGWDALHAAQVAEHWKPALVPHVLAELYRVAAPGALFFAILDTQPNGAAAADGGGPACLRPLAWWHERLRQAGWHVCSADYDGALREHPGTFLGQYAWSWFVARKPLQTDKPDAETENGSHRSGAGLGPEVDKARLVLDGKEGALGAEYSLRWVDRQDGPAVPVLYLRGKRVTRAWGLELSAQIPADPYGGNANTD